MKRFIEIHTLAALPPSCMNRDRDSYPKTTEIGSSSRGRVSSACLKRAWRTSNIFKEAFDGRLGARTKRLPLVLQERLISDAGFKEKDAKATAEKVAGAIGKVDKGKGVHTTMTFLSPGETDALVKIAEGAKGANDKDLEKAVLEVLKSDAVDIAMFGRMLADHPDKNIEAAVSVAHMFTVNTAEPEPDFFSAVDDLNPSEESGSGHLGDQYYIPSAVWYGYACVNRDTLAENLGGDSAAADDAISALIKTAATVYPAAKRTSFGTYAQASYAMVYHTDSPAHLAEAFLSPVGGNDILGRAVKALEAVGKAHKASYDPDAEFKVLDVVNGIGTLEELAA